MRGQVQHLARRVVTALGSILILLCRIERDAHAMAPGQVLD
jgi:hypothetical protein